MDPLYKGFREERYFSSLDGLRCISVIAVIWHHMASRYYQNIPLLTTGHKGVELFFAISGFLITTLLLRERDGKGAISLKKFYIRRVLRIFPLYYTIIGVYAVLVFFVEGNSRFGAQFFVNLPYYITYTSNWFVQRNDVRVIFYIAWSLATEEQFYLVWPSVERFLKGKGPVALMLVVVAGVQFVERGFFDSLISPAGLLHKIIINVAPPICMGVLLAHLLHSQKGYRIAAKILGYRWSSLAIMAVMIGLLSLPEMDAFVVQIVMVLLVASSVIRQDHWLAGLLGSTPFKKVGNVSYGMYLMHMLSFHIVDPVFRFVKVQEPISEFVATAVVTFIAASISYRYYEGYFLRLKERFAA
jgi:peptidoglycan/LPS O-acetylase OafA/YrhL